MSAALLSVEEAAALLGVARDTVYRAIRAGTLPLPVYVIGKRMRIPRRAIERLFEGEVDVSGQDSIASQAGSAAARLDVPPRSSFDTCSAARRSSSGTASV